MYFAVVSLNPPITLSYIPTVIHVLQLYDFSQLCTILHKSNFFQDVCQKCSKHPLLTVACNQRWGLKAWSSFLVIRRITEIFHARLSFNSYVFHHTRHFIKCRHPWKYIVKKGPFEDSWVVFNSESLHLCWPNSVVTIRDLISLRQICSITEWCQCLSRETSICLHKQKLKYLFP